jgi:hypothetical protein
MMGDGVNGFSANLRYFGTDYTSGQYSDYTAYGYLGGPIWWGETSRFSNMPLGSQNFNQGVEYLDQRFLAACANAKAAGVIIYTVLFRETASTAVNNYRNCATDTTKAYTAADQTQLLNVFNSIGDSIGNGITGSSPRLVK